MRGTIAAAGLPVVALPGLILPTRVKPSDGDGRTRSIPSSPTNSQVVAAGRIVTFHQKEAIGVLDSRFFTAWVPLCAAQGITMSGEPGLKVAWVNDGEAHCVSGTIWDPLAP